MNTFVSILLTLFLFLFIGSQLFSIYLKARGNIVVKIGKKKPFANRRDLSKFCEFANASLEAGNITMDESGHLIPVSPKAEKEAKVSKKPRFPKIR